MSDVRIRRPLDRMPEGRGGGYALLRVTKDCALESLFVEDGLHYRVFCPKGDCGLRPFKPLTVVDMKRDATSVVEIALSIHVVLSFGFDQYLHDSQVKVVPERSRSTLVPR